MPASTTISASEIKLPRRLTRAAVNWVSEIGHAKKPARPLNRLFSRPTNCRAGFPVSLQLLEDNAYNLESELIEQFGEAIGTAEGTAFVSGDGNGKPKGIQTATRITEVRPATPARSAPILPQRSSHVPQAAECIRTAWRPG